jgi:DNA-binding NtrC family response regulator
MARLSGVVLLVEDDEVVRSLLALDLQERGITVHEAADAESALQALEAESAEVAVLVTDLDLGPGQPNGRALAAEVRSRRPRLAVVFVTGHPRWLAWRGDRERVLEKPFALEELEAVLREALAQAS